MQKFVISELEAGQRFDKYLHKLLPEAGTGFLYKMLRKKNITLNGKKAEGKEVLHKNDEIHVFMADDTILKFRGLQTEGALPNTTEYEKAYETLQDIQIIYENKHVLILNKPAGILSQKAEESDLSMNEWVIGYLLSKKSITKEELLTFKPSVCNRLDRNTSGLLICGKSLLGSQEMSLLLKNRSVHKFYRTVVKGNISTPMKVTGYLLKDEKTNTVQIFEHDVPKASYIETAYAPVLPLKKENKGRINAIDNVDYTYLEVELLTGKTHQIRAHLASIGHPIIGDGKYGEEAVNKKFHCRAQLLHAYRLEFPVLREELSDLSQKIIIAPEPEKYNAFK